MPREPKVYLRDILESIFNMATQFGGVLPQSVLLHPGKKQAFTFKGYDQHGNDIKIKETLCNCRREEEVSHPCPMPQNTYN